VFDTPKVYEDETCPGIYFVKTDSYFPMRGTGWYYYNMIDYALSENLITKDDIKYVVKSSLSIPSNYYNKWIDHVYETLEDAKLAINSMIGGFNYNASKHENWSSVCITKSSPEAMEKFIENNAHFIDVMTIDEKKYYQVFKNFNSVKLESKSNIYNQILQQENIELHKMAKLIESKGGRVLDLITDAITCTFPDNIFPFDLMDDGKNLKGYTYKDRKPKYKIEEAHRVKVERLKKYLINAPEPMMMKPKYTMYKDVDDNNFKPLIEKMLNLNKSFTLQAPPGCGKSYFTNQLQNELKNKGLKFASMAPTNKAAIIIDGKTLNKFRIKLKTTKKMDALNLDYIIVDEISMMKEEYYAFLKMLKSYKPNLKLILVGDYNQLEPVADRVTCDYGNSQILHELADGNKLLLSKCRRADEALFKMLQFDNIPNIQRDDFQHDEHEINVCFTNEKRKEINDKYMNKKKTSDSISINAIKGDPNSQDVIISEGMPLIATKTLTKTIKKKKIKTILFQIINNKQYTLYEIDGDMLEIRDTKALEHASIKHKKYDGLKMFINVSEFQRLFYPAYCITTHKMQGETIKKPYTIHEFNRMDQKLKYVALTRATKRENINII
jgi:nucleoside-triphosphatase THEP1/ssRNA-specific RNase YbeY (16S rRNA maturation enzyme)